MLRTTFQYLSSRTISFYTFMNPDLSLLMLLFASENGKPRTKGMLNPSMACILLVFIAV